MKIGLILAILSVPAVSGVLGTRIWVKRRQYTALAKRLSRWAAPYVEQTGRPTLLKNSSWFSLNLPDGSNIVPGNFIDDAATRLLRATPGLESSLDMLKQLLLDSGVALVINPKQEDYIAVFLSFVLTLFLLPIIVACALDFNLLFGAIAGLVLSAIPFIIVKIKATAKREKFCEQLPDAIDLMVAVLRSGHSIPQSIKAVAQEIPNPCGEEFESILHKMNLGQPLAQSLVSSAQRFRSYELDLIRRAVAIQAEIGGSLAELLDRTNYTLRQRLKLSRQLKVVTAQSRLSARIVGLLPIVLAIGLNFISPGYLEVLMQDKLGQGLLVMSILLELVGIYIMQRMSTMKI